MYLKFFRTEGAIDGIDSMIETRHRFYFVGPSRAGVWCCQSAYIAIDLLSSYLTHSSLGSFPSRRVRHRHASTPIPISMISRLMRMIWRGSMTWTEGKMGPSVGILLISTKGSVRMECNPISQVVRALNWQLRAPTIWLDSRYKPLAWILMEKRFHLNPGDRWFGSRTRSDPHELCLISQEHSKPAPRWNSTADSGMACCQGKQERHGLFSQFMISQIPLGQSSETWRTRRLRWSQP